MILCCELCECTVGVLVCAVAWGRVCMYHMYALIGVCCVCFIFSQDANYAIVLEEDLDISIDFFRYFFQSTLPLLKAARCPC